MSAPTVVSTSTPTSLAPDCLGAVGVDTTAGTPARDRTSNAMGRSGDSARESSTALPSSPAVPAALPVGEDGGSLLRPPSSSPAGAFAGVDVLSIVVEGVQALADVIGVLGVEDLTRGGRPLDVCWDFWPADDRYPAQLFTSVDIKAVGRVNR